MTDVWKDHDFALPVGHPSTWEQEVEQLRAENERLREAMGRALDWLNAGMIANAKTTLRVALRAKPATDATGKPHDAQPDTAG